MHNFKKHQLVVVTRQVQTCNCGIVEPGTIIKVNDDSSYQEDESTDAQIYPDGYFTTKMLIENIRPLKLGKEVLWAKRKFSKATRYQHASFN